MDHDVSAGWHSSSWIAGAQRAGLYFVRFEALGRGVTRRLVLIR